MVYNLRESHAQLYSLNELSHHLDDDVLLEGTVTVRVDISIERLHQVVKDEANHTHIVPGDGYLVSLGLPSEQTIQASNTQTFADGEPQLICDLRYAGEENSSISIEDAVKALGLKMNEPIWSLKKAP